MADLKTTEYSTMASLPPAGARDARMNPAALYREEVYTDRAAATLRVLVPVTKDGAPDGSRPTVYMGEAQILTNMGPLPISFEIDASNLADAAAGYAEAAKEGVENAMRELQEMRRQASSSLVIPQGGVPNLGGGGKIQLP
jgi:hypothetical protein